MRDITFYLFFLTRSPVRARKIFSSKGRTRRNFWFICDRVWFVSTRKFWVTTTHSWRCNSTHNSKGELKHENTYGESAVVACAVHDCLLFLWVIIFLLTRLTPIITDDRRAGIFVSIFNIFFLCCINLCILYKWKFSLILFCCFYLQNLLKIYLLLIKYEKRKWDEPTYVTVNFLIGTR